MSDTQKTIITRREYIEYVPANTPDGNIRDFKPEARAAYDAAKSAMHRAYYSQFVTPAIKARVLMYIKRAELLESKDVHFNDIALSRWDAIVKSRLPVGEMMKQCGDYLTLGGGVCIVKEAARQIVEDEKGKVC